VSFNYQVVVSDPNNTGGAADAILAADMNAALGVYSQYLSGKGTLVVQLDISGTATGRESGGPTSTASAGTATSGLSLWQSSAEYELATGQHVTGTSSDITVTVDPAYMKQLYLSSALSPTDSVSQTLYNPVQVFMHELTHGFGMSGWYSQAGVLSGNYESVYDSFLQKNANGTASFIGTNAEAAYGGPVPITTASTTQNYYHLGNTLSDFYQSPATVASPLTLDLMNGIVFFYDYNYGISALDLGILKDLGYSVTSGLKAPTASVTLSTQYLAEGLGQTAALPASAFTDPNAQALTYKATLAGGASLPSWLQFNSTTDSFSTSATSPSLEAVTVTATDRSGLSDSQTFDLAVGMVSAASALGPASPQTPLAVGDSASTIAASLDGLEGLAAAGKLNSITLTDSGVPTLNLTAAQLVADQAALHTVGGAFTASVAAPTAGGSVTGVAGIATTLTFSGHAASYSITPAGDGVSLSVASGAVTDQVSGITALQFSDFTDVVASQKSAAGAVSSFQVASLYAAVFAREPDTVGLAYYETMAASNPSLPITTFAQNFLSSPEYTSNSAHGYALNATGDSQFITDTYSNLLHRGPASGDVAWYLANVIAPQLAGLATGSAAYANGELRAHAALLADFSQSAEFQGDVSITAQHPADASHWLLLI